MHYKSTAFSKDDNKITIGPLKPGVKIGQRDSLSKADIRKMNKHYGCKATTELTTDGDNKAVTSKLQVFSHKITNLLQLLYVWIVMKECANTSPFIARAPVAVRRSFSVKIA